MTRQKLKLCKDSYKKIFVYLSTLLFTYLFYLFSILFVYLFSICHIVFASAKEEDV